MKILFDYQVLLSQKYGGVSRYHCEIRKSLEKHFESVSCETPVIFSQNSYFEKSYGIHAVESYLPKTRSLIKFLNQFLTLTACAVRKYDIIHPTWYDPYLIKHLHKSKLVITIHDMIYELRPSEFSQSSIQNRKRYIYAADKIIAVSENTKQDILKLYSDIPEDKIVVIYESATIADGAETIDGLPEKYILFVGGRSLYKNFKNFFYSVLPILTEDDSMHLVCTGGGSFTADEKLLFEAHHLENRVSQWNLSDKQMNYVYNHAICFVYPSLYEGFGLPILEAMANECPCVISRASSFPEVAGDAAVYFLPNSIEDMSKKIKSVVMDSSLRCQLIEQGKRQNRLFSWDKTAEEIYGVYEGLLKQHRKGKEWRSVKGNSRKY